MKKFLFIIPLLLFSCKKESAISETPTQDAINHSELAHPISDDAKEKRDSMINNSPVTKQVLRSGVMREIVGNRIIRTADAEQLPFNIGEGFDKDGQEFVLKIKNFAKDNLSVALSSENPEMNVRINQIKLPNGNYDGPFGRAINNYEIPDKGEVWLIIGKSNMASGDATGNFSVSVE